MTSSEFTRLAMQHRLRGVKTLAGCKLVLVDGLSTYAAAKAVAINDSAISRALSKLRRSVCEHCGQKLPKTETDDSGRRHERGI